jgi:hypothetical protein
MMGLGIPWPHVVKIEKPTTTRDALGVPTKTLSVVSNATKAWVQPTRAETIAEYARMDMRISHTIYLESDPGVTVENIITFDERTFLVKAIINSGELGRFWKVFAEEIH